jgi:hypothetical protein
MTLYSNIMFNGLNPVNALIIILFNFLNAYGDLILNIVTDTWVYIMSSTRSSTPWCDCFFEKKYWRNSIWYQSFVFS